MKGGHSRFIVHAAVAVVLAVLIWLFLAGSLRTEIVDLRLPQRIALEPRNIAPVAPLLQSRQSRYDFIACRHVLDDLLEQSRYLKNEARFLRGDADSLWAVWKNHVGVQGGWFGPVFYVGISTSPQEQAMAAHFQYEVFRLRSRCSQIEQDADGLSADIAEADARWWRTGEWIEADQRQGASGAVQYDLAISDLRSLLSRLVARRGTLDGNIRDRQEEFDEMYPRLNLYLRQSVAGAAALTRPWHWAYVQSDRPRPSLQEDFEDVYARARAKAYRDLNATRGVSASGPRSR